ncbi:4Fe-4S binding protein [Candidatus Bathyarchaeota archaeon]|nr:4Fe-4S binding protein [Candidatus Bathyarchaeota archaeon]MBS7631618.1 4Fe-4S binding protein [Candidatus Bathyarchaeota archaeon]
MVLRKIVKINEGLCNGCGLCIPNCPEEALRIIDGRARLVSEAYCDGLGACLGGCPAGAIIIEEREAEPFNEEAVTTHLKTGTHLQISQGSKKDIEIPNRLRQWPIQLRLVPNKAPFFENAEILVTADCVPFSYPSLHEKFLRGRSLVFGCPKFDDAEAYSVKLGDILKSNKVKGLIVIHMEIPCCHGLRWIVDKALEKSEANIPVHQMTVTVEGKLRETKT